MREFATLLLILSLLSLLFVAPMYMSRLRRFLERLREGNQDAWLALDGPSLALSSFGQNSSKFQNYILKRHYRSLGDGELSELGDAARTYLLATLAFVGLMFLSFFTSMLAS